VGQRFLLSWGRVATGGGWGGCLRVRLGPVFQAVLSLKHTAGVAARTLLSVLRKGASSPRILIFCCCKELV
jgi:hypothetical protein